MTSRLQRGDRLFNSGLAHSSSNIFIFFTGKHNIFLPS
jgi:hypothetical protein